MCDCYLENPPTFYDCRMPKGRKEHKCCECLCAIRKGEKHEYVAGVWSGEFSSFRTCEKCCEMRDEINLTCYSHGRMVEGLDLRDYPGVASVAAFLDRRRVTRQQVNGPGAEGEG